MIWRWIWTAVTSVRFGLGQLNSSVVWERNYFCKESVSVSAGGGFYCSQSFSLREQFKDWVTWWVRDDLACKLLGLGGSATDQWEDVCSHSHFKWSILPVACLSIFSCFRKKALNAPLRWLCEETYMTPQMWHNWCLVGELSKSIIRPAVLRVFSLRLLWLH